jgi:hypothetical protein
LCGFCGENYPGEIAMQKEILQVANRVPPSIPTHTQFPLFFNTPLLASTMDNSTHENRMALALESCNKSLKPNYSAVAREFNLERTTLAKRHKGQTVSRAHANSIYRQLLTTAQEEQLVKQINKLTVRQMPQQYKWSRIWLRRSYKGL